MYFGAVNEWVDAHFDTFRVGVHHQIHSKLFDPLVSKLYHLFELPERIYMQQRKGRLGRVKSFHRKMQHNRTVFTDRVHHDRIGKCSRHFAQYIYTLGFELF